MAKLPEDIKQGGKQVYSPTGETWHVPEPPIDSPEAMLYYEKQEAMKAQARAQQSNPLERLSTGPIPWEHGRRRSQFVAR